MKVEQWECFEIKLKSKEVGNPFREVNLSAEFIHESGKNVKVMGFYDGNGIYKLRFMPELTGQWNYRTNSNISELHDKTGELCCFPAKEGNHGPVRVRDQYHFAYEDGKPYYVFGTTAYAWIHQSEELQKQTLDSLKNGPFNKMRMCLFPKHYDFNHNEPELYPFEGTFSDGFDFTRPNPKFFTHLERRIKDLQELSIECDLILFHPYDRWDFSCMGAENDEWYLKYVVARLSSFRNVWWSMANEYDLFFDVKTAKTTEDDWERLAGVVSANDPYGHLNSIHNCLRFYDYRKPWITHSSIQRTDKYKTSEYTNEWHYTFGKPVVIDECGYEGNLNHGWGNITGEEMTRRFWEGMIRGGYMGHGETYMHPDDILWWSRGGKFHGSSPARIAFLKKIIEELPQEIKCVPRDPDSILPESDVTMGAAGEDCYLFYFGSSQSAFYTFSLNKKKIFEVEVIDTWEMSITKLEGTYSGDFRIDLPGKPYMGVKITCVGGKEAAFNHIENNSSYSFDSTLEELLDNEQTYNLLEKYIPMIIDSPMLGMAKRMQLSKVLHYSSGQIEQEQVDALEEALRKIDIK